ncbi:MAG: hypothetical protein R6X02_04060 [Enhygromyxa sp.]
MSKLHVTVIVAAGALVLAACSKDTVTSETNADETTSGDGDGDGDGNGDGEPTAEESGDGDGDPTTTTATGFVPNDDVLGTGSCDPWVQDCPEGEKCAAWAMGATWDANKCVPLLGDGQTGDACSYDGAASGTDTCDVGFMCYYTDTEGLGSCVPLCTGSPDLPMCPSDFNCSISNDGSLLLCLYACDPLLQDCEQEGAGCFWDGSLFNCDPAGDLLEGDPCGYINDCTPGHLCLEAEALPSCSGSACCTGFCDLGEAQCQITGTECLPFFDEGTAPPGLEDTGVCALPGT